MNRLSDRMEAIVSLVPPGKSVCDVGCDHAYIDIALIQRHIAPRALAMDVKDGPLLRAASHIAEAGLTDRILVRRSDGLSKYRIGEAEVLVLSGMGGALMQEILSRYPDRTESFSYLVLSPQSELPEFRAFLRMQGVSIDREVMLCEDGKYYVVLRATKLCGGDKLRSEVMSTRAPDDRGDRENVGAGRVMSTQISDRFGPLLLAEKSPVLRQFLLERLQSYDIILCKLKSATGERTRNRIRELSEERDYAEQALRLLDDTAIMEEHQTA